MRNGIKKKEKWRRNGKRAMSLSLSTTINRSFSICMPHLKTVACTVPEITVTQFFNADMHIKERKKIRKNGRIRAISLSFNSTIFICMPCLKMIVACTVAGKMRHKLTLKRKKKWTNKEKNKSNEFNPQSQDTTTH